MAVVICVREISSNCLDSIELCSMLPTCRLHNMQIPFDQRPLDNSILIKFIKLIAPMLRNPFT